MGEQDDTDCDEGGGEPTAVVYYFAENEFGCDGVADVGERGDGGGGERELGDAEGEEHGEEVEGHAEGTEDEFAAGENGLDGAEDAAAFADEVEVAEVAHAGGDEDFSGDGEGSDEGDGGPDSQGWGEDHRPAPASIWSSSGCSVREGPPATKPTAETMRKIPAQRESDICSCSQKRPSSAMTT